MCIRVADPHAENRVPIDHRHYFIMASDKCLSLRRKECHDDPAVAKTAERQFTDNDGVAR